MKADAAAQALLAAVAGRLGMAELSWDADGRCGLRLDDRVQLNLQLDPDGTRMWLFADLGPAAAGEIAYRDLLRADLRSAMLGGPVFGLTAHRPPRVTMTQKLDRRRMDAATLAEALLRFAEGATDRAVRLAVPAAAVHGGELLNQPRA